MLRYGVEQPGPVTLWSPKSWKYSAAESIKKAVGREALPAHQGRHQGHILGGKLAWKGLGTASKGTDPSFVTAASKIMLSAKEILG